MACRLGQLLAAAFRCIVSLASWVMGVWESTYRRNDAAGLAPPMQHRRLSSECSGHANFASGNSQAQGEAS